MTKGGEFPHTLLEVSGDTYKVDRFKGSPMQMGDDIHYSVSDLLSNHLMNNYITIDEYKDLLRPFLFTDENEIYDHLMAVSELDQSDEGNPNVVHTLPYADYGIQTNLPEHLQDTTISMGTQIRKYIISDLEAETIDINGKELTKQEVIDLYDSLIVENLLDSFESVREIFNDNEALEMIILNEIKSNSKYGDEMLKACTLDCTGNFTIPLSASINGKKTQELLCRIIKSKITRQRIKGGSAIQVASIGVADDLQIVFSPSGDRILYIETYLPAWSKSFFNAYADSNRDIDISKVPEDLLEMIGYRVPTEGHQSIYPMKVKGFLPRLSGSSIMVPAGLFVIGDFDNNGNMLYLMIPEFKEVYYDESKIFKSYNDYATESRKELIKSGELKDSGMTTEEYMDSKHSMREWLAVHKEEFKLKSPILEKISYNMNKKPQEQNLTARNNMIIDMAKSILTSKDFSHKALMPSNFDTLKSEAKNIEILQSMSRKQFERKSNGTMDVLSYLHTITVKDRAKMADKSAIFLDPISPITHVRLHQQNMGGNHMIGIYANHTAQHAVLQHSDLSIKPEKAFTLGGKKFLMFNKIRSNEGNVTKGQEGHYISKLTSELFASAVDNTKEQVLKSLNQNYYTADVSMALYKLGHKEEVFLLMNQPIVLEATKEFEASIFTRITKPEAMKNVMKKYGIKTNITITQNNEELLKNNTFEVQDLADAIIDEKDMQEINTESAYLEKQFNYNRQQLAVGALFIKALAVSEDYVDLIRICKADTSKGAAGPTIAANNVKMMIVDSFNERATSRQFTLLNARNLITNDIPTNASKDTLRNCFLASQLPYMQAFHTLGLAFTELALRKQIYHFNPSVKKLINGMLSYEDELRLQESDTYTPKLRSFISFSRTGKLNEKTLESIYENLMAYKLSNTACFKEYTIGEDVLGLRTARNYFINEFPSHYVQLMRDNPTVENLGFFKSLKIKRKDHKSSADSLVFKRPGKINSITKDEYTKDWESLLDSSNPKINKLAEDLVRYEFFRSGFSFNPLGFAHLTPVRVQQKLDGYIEDNRKIITEIDDYSQFVEQYIYNHLNDKTFSTLIEKPVSMSFTNEQGEIYSKFEFRGAEGLPGNESKIIKKTVKGYNTIGFTFMDFISTKVKNENVYYRLIDVNNSENIAMYERINPLGLDGACVEYEYGKDASEIESISPNRFTSNAELVTETIDGKGELINYNIFDYTSDGLYYNKEGEVVNIDDILPNVEYYDSNGYKICEIF